VPGIALDALYRTRASTSISPEKSDNRPFKAILYFDGNGVTQELGIGRTDVDDQQSL
jgi:hypothetical protein